MLKKLVSLFHSMKTSQLVMLPLEIGMLLMVLFLALSGAGYFGHLIAGVLFPLAFFVWGFMGVPMIIRKEMPWLVTIKGWLAVVEGVTLLIVCWGVAISLAKIILSAR